MSTEPQFVFGAGESAATGAKFAGAAGAVVWKSHRLRLWGARATFSLIDQGLAAGASFGVNLLLARWLPAQNYGAFAIAFAIYMFVYGFYNVMLLEPMSVLGPSRHGDCLSEYFLGQVIVHMVLVVPLGAFTLFAGIFLGLFSPANPFAGALTGFGIALPFLLLLWLARRICYAVQRPLTAATGSAFYLVSVAVGAVALQRYGRLEPFTAFVLMGVASSLAAVFLLGKFGLLRVLPSDRLRLRQILLENWNYGRWLVGSTVLSSIVSQAQVFFASGLLGFAAAGVLRAMQLPALFMTQISTAAGFLILPAFSYDFAAGAIRRMRRKALLVSVGLSTFALILAGMTWIFSGAIERALFSGKYAPYAWLMPMLVLFTVAFGPMQGFGMALRAIRKPQFDLVSGLFASPVAILCAYFGTRWWGLAGAALSLILGFAVQGFVTAFYFRRLTTDAPSLGETDTQTRIRQNA